MLSTHLPIYLLLKSNSDVHLSTRKLLSVISSFYIHVHDGMFKPVLSRMAAEDENKDRKIR